MAKNTQALRATPVNRAARTSVPVRGAGKTAPIERAPRRTSTAMVEAANIPPALDAANTRVPEIPTAATALHNSIADLTDLVTRLEEKLTSTLSTLPSDAPEAITESAYYSPHARDLEAATTHVNRLVNRVSFLLNHLEV